MAGEVTLAELLARWFSAGDQRAHDRAYEWLNAGLHASREVIEGLGRSAVDDLRQDVLVRLLARDTGKLRDAQSPLAYARTVFRRDLVNVLTQWNARDAQQTAVRDHVQQIGSAPEVQSVEARLDVESALLVAADLPEKGRLAVLLTTWPNLIKDEDWEALVEDLPQPHPTRPQDPLEPEEASRLLYPPGGPETTRQRYQRINSFNTTFKRAIKAIRNALGVDE